MRGVAAMLVKEASLSGSVSDPERRLAILEVDEATLPEIASAVHPRVIVFTNLFRDQLDRYGEVDTVAHSWERALEAGSGKREAGYHPPTIVLNADDPAVAHLGRGYAGTVVYYGVEDASVGAEAVEHASDFRICLECGGELAYDVTFYGHVGHWRCPACGNARPETNVRMTRVVLGDEATALRVETSDGELSIRLPMSGLYNAYNALAAAAGAIELALPRDAIVSALEGFSAAFGRQERFEIDGRDVRVLLGKNPTGLNQVLRTIASVPGKRRLLLFLNDGIADGRDVSWIWDADYELVQPQTVWAMASGTRAEDLALRLKYAGFGDAVPFERSTQAALRCAVEGTPEGEVLWVVPTYTAMLEVREIIAKRAGRARFWE